MTLHLIFSESGWQACQSSLGNDDQTVLLGDGVYLSGHLPTAKILKEDHKARGLSCDPERGINYAEFVELTAQNNPIVSWH